jgi:selenocysteine-specific elongation factor
MRSVILGTAGHIDHGKTTLVRTLTGIDTDRLKEEKKRGITIELGFAHLELDDVQLGIVDVPGHERFIKSMVAGAGGIDVVMLVVAADEGVMPQTREHLDICQLLGVKRGLIALNKADLVDEDWLELAIEDVRQAVAGTFLEDAAIIACASPTERGFDELKAELGRLAGQVQTRDPNGLLRLPLDRVFSLKGFGTIVTGTLVSGTVSVGDAVEVLPSAKVATVRRIQVHGSEVDKAVAGQRTAINLAGAERQEVARGEVVAHPETLSGSRMIDVRVSLLGSLKKPLARRSKVLFHLGTRQQEATCTLLDQEKLQPGESALAQLSFEVPLISLPGDRFILRGFAKQENYGTTIGGGEILRVLGRRLRPRDAASIALLAKLQGADGSDRIASEVLVAGTVGLSRNELQKRLPMTVASVDKLIKQLLSSGALVRYDRETGALVHSEQLGKLEQRLLEIVARFHQEKPLESGINREELRSRLAHELPPRLYFAVLQRLEKAQCIAVDQEIVRLPDHEVRADQALEPLAERLHRLVDERDLQAPREPELVELLDAEPKRCEDAVKLLLQKDQIVRIAGMVFSKAAVSRLEARLRDHLARNEQITAAEFKNLVGLSRKFSIALAEYFDVQKVTIRIGDYRKLR